MNYFNFRLFFRNTFALFFEQCSFFFRNFALYFPFSQNFHIIFLHFLKNFGIFAKKAKICRRNANKEKLLNIRGIAQNYAELRGLRATELLFHLKFNNFKCDLQVYAAETRMEISLKILK